MRSFSRATGMLEEIRDFVGVGGVGLNSEVVDVKIG